MSQADVDVRFVGDLNDIKRSLDDLSEYIHGWGFQIRQALVDAFAANVIEPFIAKIRETIHALPDFFRESIEAAGQNELAFERMSFALSHMRQGYTYTSESLREYAKELEKVTFVEDEAIMRMASSLSQFGLGGRNLRSAIESAIDVTNITGGSPEAEANKIGRVLSQLEQGSARGLRMLRMELADLSQAEMKHIEELAKAGKGHEAVAIVVEELTRKYGGAADVIGNTYVGQLQKLHSINENIYEDIGGALLPLVKSLVSTWQELSVEVGHLAEEFAKWLQSLANSNAAKEGAEAIHDVLHRIFAGTVEFFSRVPQMLNVIWANLKEGLAALKVQLLEISRSVLEALPEKLFNTKPALDKINSQLVGDNLTPAEKAEREALESKARILNERYHENLVTNLGSSKGREISGRMASEHDAAVDALKDFDRQHSGFSKAWKMMNEEEREKWQSLSSKITGIKEVLTPGEGQGANFMNWLLTGKTNAQRNLSAYESEITAKYGTGESGPARQALKDAENFTKSVGTMSDVFKNFSEDVTKREADMSARFAASKKIDPWTQFKLDYQDSFNDILSAPEKGSNQVKHWWDTVTKSFEAGRKNSEKDLKDGDKSILGGVSAFFGGIVHGIERDNKIAVLKDLIEGERKSAPFKSAIEDAQGVFKRIQTAAAGDPDRDIQKAQLTELGKIYEAQMKQLEHEKEVEKANAIMRDKLAKTPIGAIAQ